VGSINTFGKASKNREYSVFLVFVRVFVRSVCLFIVPNDRESAITSCGDSQNKIRHIKGMEVPESNRSAA